MFTSLRSAKPKIKEAFQFTPKTPQPRNKYQKKPKPKPHGYECDLFLMLSDNCPLLTSSHPGFAFVTPNRLFQRRLISTEPLVIYRPLKPLMLH